MFFHRIEFCQHFAEDGHILLCDMLIIRVTYIINISSKGYKKTIFFVYNKIRKDPKFWFRVATEKANSIVFCCHNFHLVILVPKLQFECISVAELYQFKYF